MSAVGACLCWQCDEPIKPARPVTTFAKVFIAAGGASIALHAKCAKWAGFVRRAQA
ncbi:hypothetical protein [Streptomyces sp. NPDC051214]|uniref:hypothetical protein n=1 Tax=Streptomyces sp. NPDC051214 TaxID=3155282 RepID=UPI00343C4E50